MFKYAETSFLCPRSMLNSNPKDCKKRRLGATEMLEAIIAIRLEATATGLEAIASRWEAIAIGVEGRAAFKQWL